MKRLAVLVSGRGSNFEAIARNIAAGRLAAEIAMLVSNSPEAKALETASLNGIPAICLPSKGLDSDAYAARVRDTLAPLHIDLVILAGFMRRVGAPLLEAYPHRILNTPPSLLPSFPGLHVQQQALDYGAKVSGCTVHFVDAGVDTGPILVQAAVPVRRRCFEYPGCAVPIDGQFLGRRYGPLHPFPVPAHGAEGACRRFRKDVGGDAPFLELRPALRQPPPPP